nr:GNAT family N-acetyltransferase [candidate division Zixibacteria bacterium]
MKIKTRRLLLREWNIRGIDNLIEGLNDLEVTKWLVFASFPDTKKDSKSWINYCIKEARKKNRVAYELAIELKFEKKVIGGASLNKINKFPLESNDAKG